MEKLTKAEIEVIYKNAIRERFEKFYRGHISLEHYLLDIVKIERWKNEALDVLSG